MRDDLKEGDVVCWGSPDNERGWGELQWVEGAIAKVRVYDPHLRICRARYADVTLLQPAPTDHVVTEEMRGWPEARRLPASMPE